MLKATDVRGGGEGGPEGPEGPEGGNTRHDTSYKSGELKGAMGLN